MSDSRTILHELANAFLSVTTAGANATAVASITEPESLITDNGFAISTHGGNVTLSTHGPGRDGASVVSVELTNQTGSFTEAPTVTIEGPGKVAPEATPVIEDGKIVGTTVQRNGGKYSEIVELMTQLGSPIGTHSDKNLLVNRKRLQQELPFITSQLEADIVTEANLNIAATQTKFLAANAPMQDENPDIVTDSNLNIAVSEASFLSTRVPVYTQGPFLVIPVGIESSTGSGARVEGYCDIRGSLAGVRVIESGQNYGADTRYVFPEVEEDIPPATVKAILSPSGRIIGFDVTNGSYGYLTIPKVHITGEGIITGTKFVQSVPYELFWEDVLDKPIVSVFPNPDVADIPSNDGTSLSFYTVRIYAGSDYAQLDDLMEDIEVICNRFPEISTVPIDACVVPVVQGTEDIFFENDFGVGELIVGVLRSVRS